MTHHDANADDAPPRTLMFSIIMPVYNHAQYVEQAIRSVVAQTYRDWELIVVDDGSTDGSGETADAWAARDERIRVIHQANAGQAAARNTAIARASGRWLAYLDSDDVYLPEALARFAAFIDAHPGAQFLYGYRHRIGRNGRVVELPGEFQDRPTGTRELFGRMFLTPQCVCHSPSLLEKSGPYDESLRSCEDYDLYLRMSLRCTFEPLGAATGYHRRHGRNVSRQTGDSRAQEARVLERFVNELGGREVLDESLIRRRLGRLYYAAGRQYFRAGRFRDAADAFAKAHGYRRTVRSTALTAAARVLRIFG